MKAKRVGIYVRVSTNEQDTEGQETELRAYVESRGWTYEVYRDKGQSGAKSVRPELTRLLGDLRKRKLDIVVVWALDRLARSLRHLLEIAEQCQALGVDLVSLRQNIDTTMPAGRLTQTGEGFWNDTVDGGEANNARRGSGILKGIPFLRRRKVQSVFS